MAGSSGALNVGDKTHGEMLCFGARAALALHYKLTREIVPPTGVVWVTWYTNERIVKGDFPSEFADVLPPPQTLRAGRNNLDGQFEYSSRQTDDKGMSGHMMAFRLSFAIHAAVALSGDGLEETRAKSPQLFFRPGFLKASKCD